MPKNKVIYVAILIIAASGLLYLGHVLTDFILPMLPWSTGAGIIVLIAGVFMEARKGSLAPRPSAPNNSELDRAFPIRQGVLTTKMLAPTLLMLFGHPFTTPMNVVMLDRLAITPVVDGKIDAEEWDALSELDGVKTYFQWEPNKLHAAATLPTGKDLLLSFDLKGDGWLNGKDNLEVRVRMRDGLPDVQTRVLDGGPATGPEWKEASGFQSSAKVAAVTEGANWTVELSLEDPGRGMLSDNADRKMGLRFDAVSSTEGSHDPFLPRTMSNVSLVLDRSVEMPEGLVFKPEYKGRTVVPGDSTKIRLTFKSAEELDMKRIEVRSEGHARNVTGMSGVPFPGFDKKGRSFMDYETRVSPEASPGFRVVRGTLVDKDGKESIVQTSFQIAPILTFDAVQPKDLQTGKVPAKIKIPVYVRSNTLRRINGVVHMDAPQGWEVKTGNDEPFVIYNSRGTVRRVFEVTVPPEVTGPYPFRMRATLGTKTVEQTVWLTVR